MPRIASTLIGGLLALTVATPASAGPWHNFWVDVESGWHTNNRWPTPYTNIDRGAVQSYMAVGVDRGWQKQNLLGEHHFEEDGKRLTPAGLARVKSILVYSPPQFRTVWVERGNTPDATAKRVDAVQQAVVGLTPEGSLAPVLASDLLYEGWSSEQADMVGRKYNSSVPSPRLPSSTGAASGGASQ